MLKWCQCDLKTYRSISSRLIERQWLEHSIFKCIWLNWVRHPDTRRLLARSAPPNYNAQRAEANQNENMLSTASKSWCAVLFLDCAERVSTAHLHYLSFYNHELVSKGYKSYFNRLRQKYSGIKPMLYLWLNLMLPLFWTWNVEKRITKRWVPSVIQGVVNAQWQPAFDRQPQQQPNITW